MAEKVTKNEIPFSKQLKIEFKEKSGNYIDTYSYTLISNPFLYVCIFIDYALA